MTFTQLSRIADHTVAAIEGRLPAEVRAAAKAIVICLETRPGAALLEDGAEPDILGMFVGPERQSELTGDHPLPPQILLFLENIWDYAAGDEAVYRDEVRLTYLHELGHYLGWDEEEVARRGLE